jgi:nucleotide-binding universal stress UspA family protein
MRVLLATDFSSSAAIAMRLLAKLSWAPSAVVEILHMVPTGGARALPMRPGFRAQAAAGEAAAVGMELQRRLGQELTIHSATRPGDPRTAILTHAAETGAELVVVGSHGRGHFAGHVLGSVAAAVAADAPCPVLIARRESVRSLVVGDDLAANTRSATTRVLAWRFFDDVPIAVTSVLAPSTATVEQPADHSEHRPVVATVQHVASARLEQRVEDLRAAGRLAIGRLAHGEPAVELLRTARVAGADLIVVGAGDRSDRVRGLGQVATSVLSGFRGSVLIARDVPEREVTYAASAATGRAVVAVRSW